MRTTTVHRMTKATKTNPTSFRFTTDVIAALRRIAAAQGKPQITVVEYLILEADAKSPKGG